MGSGFVGRNVFQQLARAGQPPLEALVPEGWNLETPDTLRVRLYPVKPGVAHKFLRENVLLRRAIRRNMKGTRLFSLTDTSMLLCPVPHLLLVQQAYLAHAWHTLGLTLAPLIRQRFKLMELHFRLGLPSVTKLTVQSDLMKNRISSRWNIPPETIVVVPSSASLPRQCVGSWHPPQSQTASLFCPTHGGPHKNNEVLIPMMAELRKQGIDAVCFLTAHPFEVSGLMEQARRLRLVNRFRILGRIPRSQVLELMRSATAVILPSKMESFGLSYYEAMGIGSPIVASDLEFAREACGPAAVYCNPDSGEEYAQAVLQLLHQSALSEDLSLKGRSRYERLDRGWEWVANQYRTVLEGLARWGG
ncbi:MAG: glycosyltransferase [Actinomycetota bacterium]